MSVEEIAAWGAVILAIVGSIGGSAVALVRAIRENGQKRDALDRDMLKVNKSLLDCHQAAAERLERADPTVKAKP